MLVATDAVARGIDVADVKHVIQFDLPSSQKVRAGGGRVAEWRRVCGGWRVWGERCEV